MAFENQTAQALNDYNYAQTNLAAPKETAVRKARRALERVMNLESSVIEMANELVGHVPQPCDGAAEKAGYDGALPELEHIADQIVSAVSRAEEELSRIRAKL